MDTSEPADQQPRTATGAEPVRTPMIVRTGLGAAMVIALALMLAVDSTWPQGYLYLAVIMAMTARALSEYSDTMGRLGLRVGRSALVLGGVGLVLVQWTGWNLPHLGPYVPALAWLAALAIALLTARVVSSRIENAWEEISASLAGWIYVPLLLGFLTGTRIRWGVAGLITVVAVCKAASTGAYFIGSWLGRRKLAPRLSPGKTWAGLFGAVLGSVAVAWALSHSPWALMSPVAALLFGLLIAAAATAGDLAESLLKREADIKDSGQIAPGFGGMLDMLDDLLFAAPVGFLFLSIYTSLGA
ncbi:MAG: phosphatidate cytidylyltransferase [Candidatus Brocadiia bacterium]